MRPVRPAYPQVETEGRGLLLRALPGAAAARKADPRAAAGGQVCGHMRPLRRSFHWPGRAEILLPALLRRRAEGEATPARRPHAGPRAARVRRLRGEVHHAPLASAAMLAPVCAVHPQPAAYRQAAQDHRAAASFARAYGPPKGRDPRQVGRERATAAHGGGRTIGRAI